MATLALLLVMLGAPQTATRATKLQVLTVYAGSWTTMTAQPGTTAATDHLTNHCSLVDAFYTCEQVLNGKPSAMLVFVGGEKAGSYHSTVILPDGKAMGRGDLTVDGNHWTFLSKDAAGKPSFRVENYFKDRDHIHFEQYKATEGGAWEKVGEGDEVREP